MLKKQHINLLQRLSNDFDFLLRLVIAIFENFS